MKRRITAVVALAVALAGCGSGDDDSATTESTASTVSSTEAAPVTDPPATDPSATDAPTATDPPATQPPATEPPTTEPPTTEPAAASYIEAAGLATIELMPTEAGEQPVLAWTPVDGAASYRLAALTSDGSPYWAWIGEATEVRFGGLREDGGHTAIVFEPMMWRVVALDAEGLPIAASEPGELTP